MSIDYAGTPAEQHQKRAIFGTCSKLVFGAAPPEELQKMIDKSEALVMSLQAVIDDPTISAGRKNLCRLSMEQETTMLEMYREAQKS